MSLDDLKVVKFGGWSVGTPENTDASIDLVAQDSGRRVVVVSGPKGLTDLYILAAKERIQTGTVKEDTYREIKDKWEQLCNGLNLGHQLQIINNSFSGILGSYNGPSSLDDLAAKRFMDNIRRLGEAYEAEHIFVPRLNQRAPNGLQALFLDPRDLIIGTDAPADASILPESVDKLRNKIVASGLIEKYVIVLPGFYVYTKDGHIVTLPRGGSDTTGSFVAFALDASLYENVSNNSIRRASPDAVENALHLSQMTYFEGLELGYAGFGIFKDEAILPCLEKLIPIHVIDMSHPDMITKILAHRQPDGYDVTGIAYKKGFGSINIRKILRSRQEGHTLGGYVLHTESGVTRSGEFPIEHIMTGVSNVSFLIPGEKFSDEVIHRLKRHLMEYYNLSESDVEVKYNISLVSVVGQDMKDRVGVNYRAAGALASVGLSTSHLIQGGSELSIIYGFHENDGDARNAKKGVKAIYNEFFVDNVFGRFLAEQRHQLKTQNRNP